MIAALTAACLALVGAGPTERSLPAFPDSDGDLIHAATEGPGALIVSPRENGAAPSVTLRDTTPRTRLVFSVKRHGGDGLLSGIAITAEGPLAALTVTGGVVGVRLDVAGNVGEVKIGGSALATRVRAAGALGALRICGDLRGSSIAVAGDVDALIVEGDMADAIFLAGARVPASFELTRGTYAPATVGLARVAGDVVDSVIAAGGDPGPDGRFQDGEVLLGGLIWVLDVGGMIRGAASAHVNPGIYAARIEHIHAAGRDFDDHKTAAAAATTGSAVIDPLPKDANALDPATTQLILRRAVKRATQLKVNATIAVVDREGNILAVVRMDDPKFNPARDSVKIKAGGRGGLEAVDNIVPTSIIAATKAGTAAFLSTSTGNAFTPRTAGFIIQTHFPPGVAQQDSGPLFGVQLSSLPTSDVNRLPLGLSADPGAVPLYRNGELIGGLGVEVNGVYTVDTTRVGGAPTVEEAIALAGQINLAPPQRIRADQIFVDGIRLDFANDEPPTAASLGSLPKYNTLVSSGLLVELIAPRATPLGPAGRGSLFKKTKLAGISGEVPDASRAPAPSLDPNVPGASGALGLDFWDEATGAFAFLDGDANGPKRLTAADVLKVLTQAHKLNHKLRAAIRRDRPQRSQVTVAVVDYNGNVLGAFRTPDAPMFGYDVAVQKGRTAAFFSRPDAGVELAQLDTEVDVAFLKTIGPAAGRIVDPGVSKPYTRHVNKAKLIGVLLDGTIAMSDRTGGFLSRPNLPDGIDSAPRGPFSALSPDQFSPFNTGLQTILAIPELVEFLLAFTDAGDEAVALARFTNGALGGGGVVPLDGNAGDAGLLDLNPGGGLPELSLANGMQIFAGSVPLYKGGVLVGAVGVSGDGIEQDDFVAFSGAKGFQSFGSVKRADKVTLTNGIRLPYVKFPRAPFAGQ